MSDPSQADHEDTAPLLDDMWQRQQIKTFTAWANSHLRKRDLKIENLSTDLGDGKLLLNLMEIVGDSVLPKPAKHSMRIHKIQNVSHAFNFIKEKGVKLVSIGPEEIVDGNLKMILGMLWTIILRFEIQDISVEEMSAKDALLLWCQRKTKGYDNVSIDNFHMSWKDGLGFAALIHKHRPDLIDYSSLRKDDPATNMQTAFDVADKELDIPPMLDVSDMVECVKPDERSVMTYIAAYYKYFAKSNKNEASAKKIASVLETNREHERLIEEYETRASDLLAWIQQSIEYFSVRGDLNSVEECQEKLSALNAFRSAEYPPKLIEKGDLEAHFSTLQTRLRLSGRPAYVPSEGKLVSDINEAWGGLSSAENDHQQWVLDELKRCQIINIKAQKFNYKADAHEKWTSGKQDSLTADDYTGQSLSVVQMLKKKHTAFQSDLTAHEHRVHEIGTLANELDELRYVNADATNDRYATIYESWQTLVKATEGRQAALDEAEQLQQQLDDLRLQFAQYSAPLINYLEEVSENLTDSYVANTPEDVVALQTELATQKEALATKGSQEYETLTTIHSQMEALGSTDAPYSTHTFDSVNTQWAHVQELLVAREEQLNTEAQNQDAREQIRQKWASAAKATHDWIAESDAAIKAVVASPDYAKMEDQVADLEAHQASVNEYTFDDLEAVNKEVNDALIFSNPHTTLSIEVLRGEYQQIQAIIKRSLTELENQILTRDSKNLSEEALKEYRESFKHFDKDGSGQLDRLEFRGCLLSLGYDIPQVPPKEGQPDPEFDRVMARVDPNSDSHVSFDEFIAFMAEENADAETSDQLLEAFAVLAGGKDYVLAADLQRDLEPELAEYCVQNMTPFEGGPEGALDYKSFSGALYGQSDL